MLFNVNLIDDFIGLFYPKICISCNTVLLKHEFYLCTQCKYFLPRAKFHEDIEHSLIKKTLYGRVPVFGSAAYYLFSKKSGVQNILHHIKYKQGKLLAKEIGIWMSEELKNADWIKDVEILIPIPLHPKKQIERGYNQSEEYCKGIEATLNIPTKNILKKNIYTLTQTRKKRYERWENVKDNFEIDQNISGIKHLVLVDDVMTTGATFEAAYNALISAGYNGKVSIITIAVATYLV
ncbi:MAG: ComF family protein [Bacteroidia bacterium]|nr:ComF family protein [Bacteroidia bacterium]